MNCFNRSVFVVSAFRIEPGILPDMRDVSEIVRAQRVFPPDNHGSGKWVCYFCSQCGQKERVMFLTSMSMGGRRFSRLWGHDER